jgi:hypothetical protein
MVFVFKNYCEVISYKEDFAPEEKQKYLKIICLF